MLIVEVPGVEDGGASAIEPGVILSEIEKHDLVAAAGTEALVAARDCRRGSRFTVRNARGSTNGGLEVTEYSIDQRI